MSNIVYIAKSMDGFIADEEGGLDWLNDFPKIPDDDFGYQKVMDRVDALLMGRLTYETVRGFEVAWPYEKKVFVLSKNLNEIPDELEGRVEKVHGELEDVLHFLQKDGYQNLYIDGGKTIQSFLRAGLIDEMIISTLPIVLGGGVPLFGDLEKPMVFDSVESEMKSNGIVVSHYTKPRTL